MFFIDRFFTFNILTWLFILFFRVTFFIWLWIRILPLILFLGGFLIELFNRIFLFSNLLRIKRWRAWSLIVVFFYLNWFLIWSFWFAVWKCFYLWVWSATGLLFWFWFGYWLSWLILFSPGWRRRGQIKIALNVLFWSYKLFLTFRMRPWFTSLFLHKIVC